MPLQGFYVRSGWLARVPVLLVGLLAAHPSSKKAPRGAPSGASCRFLARLDHWHKGPQKGTSSSLGSPPP
jgi:hypothetical protein